MHFNIRNLRLYNVHEQPRLDLNELQLLLSEHEFAECGKHEARRIGFSSPLGRHREELIVERHGHLMLRVLRQEKILPPSVINETLEQRCEEFAQTNGFAPPRREKQAIKETVFEELLPRAFAKNTHVDLWWDVKSSRIGVFTSSNKRADECLNLLRQALGSLKVTPLSTKSPASRVMTSWICDPETKPDGLMLGDGALITGDDNGSLRARSFDLDSDEIHSALAGGRCVSQLSLSLEGEAKFTLRDDVSLTGIRLDDQVLDEIDSMTDGAESHEEYIAIEFGVVAVTLVSVVKRIINWLGGEPEIDSSAFALSEGTV
ncbi:recombination-associated protein RdgC [Carnimonas bestiolae]|uniref:recombination-associated protein RdgC n=1 Tax=Carnimonas bestiolae TaxID=3402172 RepID=UPI003EDC2DF5